MANITQVIKAEINPLEPVQEICAVMAAVMPYHPGQEEAILRGVQDAIERRMKHITKGAGSKDEQVL
jgi:hypothetical protein